MARSAPVHVCSACGHQEPRWHGRCPGCGEWNTLVEERPPAAGRGTGAARKPRRPPAPVALADVLAPAVPRLRTRIGELDRVLGGGIVPGSVILLGGEPGIGKSTLFLQVAAHIGTTRPVVYASGEESVAQVQLRAQRLGLASASLSIVCETDLPSILALAADRSAAVLIIDSIQTLQSGAAGAGAGAITQLRECTAELVRYAKSAACAVVIVGHVTKEGAIAGPRLL